MRKTTTAIFTLLFLFAYSFSFAQCNLDFGAGNGFTFTKVNSTDIVNGGSSGANFYSKQLFDIWDETTGNCSVAGGVEDVTIEFEIIPTFDPYNPDSIIDYWTNTAHDVTQSSSGLKGFLPLGNSSTAETTAGDVRCYSITVTFASHVDITADEITVNMNSVNTIGSVFESGSLVFLDAASTPANAPYGSVTYNGFYGAASTGPSTDGTCTSVAPSTEVYTEVGPGVYSIAGTSTVDLTLPCDPTSGTSSGLDGKDVNAVTDAGLTASDAIGGFIYKVCLEDVAGSTSPLDETTTSTGFSSTLNSISIINPLPVELVNFTAKAQSETVELDWTTASEENNSHFEIEHSVNGQDFTYLDKVIGAGTSVDFNNYTFVHQNPAPGKNYYRLRQVDMDGAFAYSSIANASIKLENQIAVHPTLVSNSIYVVLGDDINTEVALQIVDVSGSKVQEAIIESSDKEMELPLDYLNKGVYFLQFQVGTEFITRRFMKLYLNTFNSFF